MITLYTDRQLVIFLDIGGIFQVDSGKIVPDKGDKNKIGALLADRISYFFPADLSCNFSSFTLIGITGMFDVSFNFSSSCSLSFCRSRISA